MKQHRFAAQLRTYFVFILLIQLIGCATISKVETVGDSQPALADKCQIEIIDKSALPIGSKIIGNIETHIKGNIFFGGVVRTNDEGYKELRTKACALGGNAVVIDDLIESSAAEMRHIHIWARALIIPKT